MALLNGNITIEIIDKEIITVELPHGVHTHSNGAQLDLITDGDHDVRTDNPHSVTKTQVGLSNVDNTSDVNKPVSTATQAAIDALESEMEAGDVDSVNGETGIVVLTQDDIDDGTTYKQYSQTEKTKLAGIEASAAALTTVKADTDIADAITKKHVAATAGTGISVTGQEIANTDLGSSAVSTHEGTYTHSDIHASGSDNQDLSGLVPKTYEVNGNALSGNIDLVAEDILTEDSGITTQDALNTLEGASHSNTLDHTQGTDQALDTGGANEITAINAKSAYTHSGVTSGNPHSVTKSDVGLGNVANVDTTDANNIDTDATGITVQDKLDSLQSAIEAVESSDVDSVNGETGTVILSADDIDTDSTGVTVQGHIDDTNNPHSVTKTQVGLSNVDNVSEATIIADVKSDEDVASAISLKHVSGSDDQDASEVDTEDSGITVQDALNTLESDKVDKITDYSLVADTEIAKIHVSGSDDQDLSGLVPKTYEINGNALSGNVDLVADDIDTDASGVTVQDNLDSLNAAPPAHTQNASTIIIPDGINSPPHDDMQDFLDGTQSSGRHEGGVISEHAGPDGTVDITELEGLIRKGTTIDDSITWFKSDAVSGLTLAVEGVNFIIATYNSETGEVDLSASASRPAVAALGTFVLGRVFKKGNNVECISTGQNIYDQYGRIQDRLLTKYGQMDNASGGIIGVHATPLRLTCSAGIWYTGNTQFTTAEANTFEVWYKDGSATWQVSGPFTLFSEVFDSGTSTVYETYQDGNNLADLANQYGVYWIFICPEGDLYVVLGDDNYTTISLAQAASVPAALPPYCVNWAKFLGKVIIKDGAAAFFSVESGFSQSFTLSTAVDHAGLYNLGMSVSGHTWDASVDLGAHDIIANNLSGTNTGDQTADEIDTDETGTTVQDVIDKVITSTADGDWKKVTSLEYNPSTGNLRVKYEDGA